MTAKIIKLNVASPILHKDSKDELPTAHRLFAGDSIEKKRLQEKNPDISSDYQSERKRKGPNDYDKPWRQVFPGKADYSKENKVLKPFLRRYNNVDENVLAVRAQNNCYQLVHERIVVGEDEEEVYKTFQNVSRVFQKAKIILYPFCFDNVLISPISFGSIGGVDVCPYNAEQAC